MIYLTFLSAILLSGIAAYYSVIGLAAIFTGAFWPIVFMGSVLEMSKLVTASWLYRNWKTCPLLLKSYLTTAVVILMLITSMGIFGFLSKAHIDSTLDAGSNIVEVKSLNQQEKMTQDKLDYLMARAKEPSNASNKLDKQIQDTQRELADINKRKLPLLKESNKLVAEVGPIKYVADMIYGNDENGLDKAVRLVIMLIMVVFDPLAVLLLISANISLKEKDEKSDITTGTPPELDEVQEETRIQKSDQDARQEIESKIQVDKENIVTITERAPSVTVKTLEPKYDYEAPYSFREKESK